MFNPIRSIVETIVKIAPFCIRTLCINLFTVIDFSVKCVTGPKTWLFGLQSVAVKHPFCNQRYINTGYL